MINFEKNYMKKYACYLLRRFIYVFNKVQAGEPRNDS